MNTRRFGRTNWNISEIGYGMWGLAGWTGNEEDEIERALEKSVELDCNFFDTAWGYGAGKSEQILENCFADIQIKSYMLPRKFLR